MNIPSLSSQSQRAKNTIHCFRSLKHYLISGLISVYTSWLVFWSEFLRHVKSRNLSKILLFFSRLYLFLPLYLSATQVSRIRLSWVGTGDWLADDPVVTLLNSNGDDIQTDEHHWINPRGKYLSFNIAMKA